MEASEVLGTIRWTCLFCKQAFYSGISLLRTKTSVNREYQE